MEYYEYWKEKNKCTYDLYLKSCRECLFQVLCRLELDKCKDTHGQDQTL